MVEAAPYIPETGEPTPSDKTGPDTGESTPIDSNDGVAIIDSNDGVASIDSNDAPLSVNTDEIIAQLSDNLPEGGEEFSNRTASEIVERVLTGEENDLVTHVRETIKTEHTGLTESQAEELLGVTLLKASQKLSSLTNEFPEQSSKPSENSGINPTLPNTNPADGDSLGVDMPETSGDQPSDNDQENNNSDKSADDAQQENIDL